MGPALSVPVKEIRDLAQRFSSTQIENCISHQLDDGSNPCAASKDAEAAMDALAKADFVRQLMEEQGMSLSDALRDLGRRIRSVQEGGAPE